MIKEIDENGVFFARLIYSITITSFFFFKVSNKILYKLVRIQQRFLWGGGLEQRKIAWVK